MVKAMTVLSVQPRPRTDSCHGRPHAPAEPVALTRFLHGARGVGCWFDRVESAAAGPTDPALILHALTADPGSPRRCRPDGIIATVGDDVSRPLENGIAHKDLVTPVGQPADRRVSTTRGNSHA